MTWILLAIGATFLWSFVNIFDQYLVKKYAIGERGSGGLVLFSSLIGIFIALFIAFFTNGIFNIPNSDKILLIIAGGLSIAWIIIYLYTIETEDISVIVPWFSLVPVFGYILAYIYLDEVLNTNQIIGSLIIILGVVLISINFENNKKNIFKLRTASYMSLVCFIIAVIGVIFKEVTIIDNFWISSFWEYFGLGMFGILIYIFIPKYRKEFNFMNKSGGLKIFTLNTASEFMTIVGNLFTNFAILLTPITMVYLVESFQPAVVLLLVILGTHFYPKIINERIDSKILLPKMFAIILMIIGSIFLFL